MDEIWRTIAGYEGHYEVSDQGRVRSLDRVLTDGRSFKGRVMKPSTLNGGHKCVGLSRGNKVVKMLVHRLVLMAFVGPPGPDIMGRHLNGKPHDNRLVNLAWGTCSQNERDKIVHGTHNQSRKTSCPRGHLLKEPNLTAAFKKRGIRQCRACALSATWLDTWPQFRDRMQLISDKYYERISEGSMKSVPKFRMHHFIQREIDRLKEIK